MNPQILPVVLSGSLILATPLFAQEPVPIEGHVTIPVEKQPLENVVVKRTSVHPQGDHAVVMQKIAPPELPEDEAVPQPALSRGTLQMQGTPQAFQAGDQDTRPRKVLGISATIYDHHKTYLEWTAGEQRFAAWSNVDFNYLSQVPTIATAEAIYSVTMFPTNADTTKLAALYQAHGQTYQVPQTPAFPSNDPSLIVTQGDSTNAAVLAPVQALLQLYRDNETGLKSAYVQRMADAAAQQAYDEAHPKQPKDTTVQFWKRPAPTVQTTSGEGEP